MNATEIALAFNQQNPRKTWHARPTNTSVHFNTGTGLVALIYETTDGTFQVRFNKFQAAWGDYVKAIARTLQVVLSTLKSAGLPFDAPESEEGIDIVTTVGKEGAIYVRYDPPKPLASAIMPEIAYTGPAVQMLAQMANSREAVQAQHDSLIAAGAKWDGMDGYDMTDPPGTIGGAEIIGDDG